MIDKKCLECDFYDPDFECTCSSYDKWYACLLEKPTPEDFSNVTKSEKDRNNESWNY